ncbi:uncharacterized protein LOC124452011 [Xenia sp. Carnegie-2017]|uniref:uncharacterized protein LOC124452011 n=1 Tax=Xenia sp. Carnegie-2017 TaxID=2897299 RepID=UPI001F034F04|nr:uncharacterized protein LOC124452011 [Xenia sp. Carnegie-2017]
MANDEEKLNIKLTQLKLSAQRTAKILDSGKRETIERQLNALKTTINEADNFERAVEAAKIEREDDLEEISDWNAEIETKISEAEDEINKLQHWLNNRKLEEENHAREEQIKFEVKLQETQAQINATTQNSKSEDSKISDEEKGVCVYCEGNHKSGECKVISTVKESRAILVKKKLCFNCTAGQHLANACPSKSSCRNCLKRHHTSICDVTNQEEPLKTGQTVLTTDGSTGEGIFPILVVKINGITCRALIDSGAGRSYISGRLASMLRVKPIETQTTKVHMLLTSKTTRLEIYEGKLKQ